MSGSVSTGVAAGANSSPTEGETPDRLWEGLRRWLHRAYEVVSASAPELNRLNVFPISDSDTGTNTELTLAGILAALPTDGRTAEDVVQAAVPAAHGNSGAIVVEMLISVSRELLRPSPPTEHAGVLAAQSLRVAARAATHAVARPVAGTILTVADDAATAAEAAAEQQPDDVLAVVDAARRAANDSLARTPEQLAVLAEAGVVDAGGQAYVLLLDVLSETLGGERARPLDERIGSTAPPTDRAQRTELLTSGEYEVMYALVGASPEALATLRETLSAQGDSVVVVGDQTIAQVHVHLADAGAAVEAGLALGALSSVRITALPAAPAATSRAVIVVVAGTGLAEAVTDLGGVPVLPAEGHVRVEDLERVLDEHCGDPHCRELVMLPNDMETLEVVRHLAAARRRPGRRIAVIPTTAQVQGLAALAVHEPSADFDSAVVAMSTAAGHARHGAVTIAETPAMTMAGRCEVGDVLGLLDGDFVEIGSSVVEVAERIIVRLTASGGELLTLITGADADPDLVPALRQSVRDPGLEIEVVAGQQRRYPLLIGLE